MLRGRRASIDTDVGDEYDHRDTTGRDVTPHTDRTKSTAPPEAGGLGCNMIETLSEGLTAALFKVMSRNFIIIIF